jgi:predicted anti-sigma-YlaC factor YlaD
MKECPDTDAIVTIADALEWDVVEGLRHLQTCDDCRARLDTLQVARAALSETQPVDAALLARVAHAVSVEAQDERERTRRTERRASALEALLAGVAAPVVLISSGFEIGSVAAGLLTCALGATLLIYGRRLRLYAA